MVTSRQIRQSGHTTHFKQAVSELRPYHNNEYPWSAQYSYDRKGELYVLRKSPTNGVLGMTNMTPYQSVPVAYHVPSDQWFAVAHPAVAKPHLPKQYLLDGEWRKLEPTGLTKHQMDVLVRFGLAELAKERLVREGYERPKTPRRVPRVKLF